MTSQEVFCSMEVANLLLELQYTHSGLQIASG